MRHLYSFRNRGEEHVILDKPDWVLHSVSLSEDLPGDFPTGDSNEIKNVVVLNWGYGSVGTITSVDNYQSFANLCAIYAESSSGCSRWIIGSEPNHEGSWPDGVKISPQDYANCFRLCREAIKKVKPEDQVFVAAVISLESPESGSWMNYLGLILENLSGYLDGFASHFPLEDFLQKTPDFIPPPFVLGDADLGSSASPSLDSSIESKERKMIKQAEYLREDEVILALRSALGNLDIASRGLAISRGQLQDYIVNHPAVREEKIQIKEAIKDDAEDQLVQRMKTNDNLLMFFLRTQARERGYEPNVPLVGADGKSLSVTLDARSLIAAMRQGLVLEANGDIDSDETKESSSSDSNGA